MSDKNRDDIAPPAPTRVSALGHGPMDRIHAEFDELLARASPAFTGNWAQLLGEIDAHLRAHFEAEDLWMRETDFPPRECHMGEHAAVLRSSQEVLALACKGDFRAAPSFLAELARWFPGHADHLDSALAAWLCKRQYGGKPIVIHRTPKPTAV